MKNYNIVWFIFLLILLIAIIGKNNAMENEGPPKAVIINVLERQPSSDDLCQTALALYMARYSPSINARIAPHLRNMILEAQQSQHHAQYVEELKRIYSSRFEDRGSPQLEMYIRELITKSLEEAFHERDKKELFHRQELEQERWKFKVAMVTNLGSVALTALIANYFGKS